MPGGGLVISFADVSQRADAEAALEQANTTLEGRVAERTATLLRVNSELDSARKKADAANRDKTRFLAAASHDLLQPLERRPALYRHPDRAGRRRPRRGRWRSRSRRR